MTYLSPLVAMLLWSASVVSKDLDDSRFPRQVVKILAVDNGQPWGAWERADFCPVGTYVTGLELKLDKPHFLRADDTGLNGISLLCTSPSTREYHGSITSQAGPWGVWDGVKECTQTRKQQFFFTSFQLRVERSRGSFGDDTSVNNIRFKCRPLNRYENYIIETRGTPWGTWGKWSESCPMGTAICGIQVRMSAPRGNQDDSALNDVRIFCCKDFRITMSCTTPFDFISHDLQMEEPEN